jgi:hypothetical protein
VAGETPTAGRWFGTWYCYSHGVVEPTAAGDYLTCGECNHVYRTEADLIETYAKQDLRTPADGSAAWHCPLCAHDF